MIDGVGRFGGGQGDAPRDTPRRCDSSGSAFLRPAATQTVETRAAGNLGVCFGDLAFRIEEDLDLAVAFGPRDRINREYVWIEILLILALSHDQQPGGFPGTE